MNGTTTTLRVIASNAAGGVLTYHWNLATSPSGAPLPTINAPSAATSTVTFLQAGVYSFQVTVTNQKGSTTAATVNVTVNSVLTSIVMTPATATLLDGAQQQFTANAFDQFKQPIATTFKWSIASGVGSVSSTGLFTAPPIAAQITNVKASAAVNGVTVFRIAAVTLVAAPKITAISAALATTGTAATLKVAAGNPNGGGLNYAWSVLRNPPECPSPPSAPAAPNLTTATFFQAGSYSFQVIVTNQYGQTTTAHVNITVNSKLTYAVVSPAAAIVARGLEQQFVVVAQDQFRNALTNASIVWSRTGLGSVNASNGLYQAPASTTGTAVVKARVVVNGIAMIGSAAVTVI